MYHAEALAQFCILCWYQLEGSTQVRKAEIVRLNQSCWLCRGLEFWMSFLNWCATVGSAFAYLQRTGYGVQKIDI